MSDLTIDVIKEKWENFKALPPQEKSLIEVTHSDNELITNLSNKYNLETGMATCQHIYPRNTLEYWFAKIDFYKSNMSKARAESDQPIDEFVNEMLENILIINAETPLKFARSDI